MKKIVQLLILCSVLQLSAQQQWELKKSVDQIEIFTRDTPQKSIKEYKAITTVSAPMEAVIHELLTAPAYNDMCESGVSYYLRSPEKDKHLFYAQKSLPWPVRDRDVITLLTVKRISPNKVKLLLEGAPAALPEQDNMIRINELMGYWLLEEMDGKTKVTQVMFIDPNGSLPPFVVNALLVKGPLKTFRELRLAVQP